MKQLFLTSKPHNLLLVGLVCSAWMDAGLERVVCDQGPVSSRPTTVKSRQFSQSNRRSTIGIRQTEYHEALPSSVNDEVRCDCTFAEWRWNCENCRHLTVVGLHDTGLRSVENRCTCRARYFSFILYFIYLFIYLFIYFGIERESVKFYIVNEFMVSANNSKAKINAISALSNVIAELSLRTKRHTAGCSW